MSDSQRVIPGSGTTDSYNIEGVDRPETRPLIPLGQKSYDGDEKPRMGFFTDTTVSCVSNEVGGGLVSNAKWTGVPLSTVLREAGVAPDKASRTNEQLVGRSVDGWTAGFRTQTAFEREEALVAFAMIDDECPSSTAIRRASSSPDSTVTSRRRSGSPRSSSPTGASTRTGSNAAGPRRAS